MSYLVLARKYRPQTFDVVIGQEHITDLLKRAIETNHIAHAYLFCGPRGVGKTSCARILAKSLNCEKGPTTKPCQKCPACTEITKTTSFDVLEIDGASNRGIDEIRTLRENVKFAPNYGNYKVYIVDEVHMLTTEAFNALLKTLEEPPAHVKFIFATTAPNKVPVTIISRCQRFDFKRISIKIIVYALTSICKKEKLNISQDALYAIGKAAQGSFRDALSILDQLSVLSEKSIDADDVYSMLGLVETSYLFELADALGQKDCSSAYKILEKIIDKGKDIRQLVKDIVFHFRNLMIIKVGGKSLGKMVDYPINIKEMLLKQSEKFSMDEILTAIDTFIEAQEVSRITESIQMPLEIAFAKLTYDENANLKNKEKTNSKEEIKQKKEYSFSPISTIKNKRGQVDISGNSSDEKAKQKDVLTQPENDDDLQQEVEETEEVKEEIDKIDEDIENLDQSPEYEITDIKRIKQTWDALTYAVSRKRMSIATYLQNGFPIDYSAPKLVIGFSKNHTFSKESLETSQNIKFVEEVFSEKLNSEIHIHYEIVDDFEKQEEETGVKNVLDAFEGKVVSRWHNES